MIFEQAGSLLHNKNKGEIIIRKAQYKDAFELADIELECFPVSEAATLEQFQIRLRAFKNHFYVACLKGNIIGFINGCVTDDSCIRDEMYDNVSWHKENGFYQTVFGLDVLPEYRHTGLAHRLMEYFITQAEIERRKAIILTCKKNLIGFYETMGFHKCGISNSVHGNAVWYDMELKLNK